MRFGSFVVGASFMLASLLALCLGCGSGITTANASLVTLATPPAAGPTPCAASATLPSAHPLYLWTTPSIGSVNSLGTVQYVGPTLCQTVLSPTITGSGGTLSFVSASRTTATTGDTVALRFQNGSQFVNVDLVLTQQGPTLTVDLSADQPVISKVDLGSLASALNVTPVAVPFYSQPIYQLARPAMFANVWWDWHHSGATQAIGSALIYSPRTDGSLPALHEEFSLALSPEVDDVFPQVNNPPSPFVAELSGKAVVDVWGSPTFASIATDTANLSDHGLSDCVELVHDWQGQGYDNALPLHFPANPALGSSSDMVQIAKAAKGMGCRFGLHQNYMDYYRDFPYFDPQKLAKSSSGGPIVTYTNTLHVQAYEAKPSQMMALAARQSPRSHATYGTSAAFLDVNSSLAPWQRVDMDATVTSSGSSVGWMDGAAALWNFERATEAGPVFGEGKEHWYYSGMLDGVEAQLGAGGVIASNTGESLPLFVDFDLLRIHPLQVNHGMGYYERWNPAATVQMTTAQMDQYRMQEIAFGHAPYVGTAYWNDVVHAVTESRLVGPVSSAYGADTVSSILYQVGSSWVPPSSAVSANTFSRVQVTYKSGLTITANSAANPLAVGDLTLPEFGWLAQRQDLLAFTALCGATICDYAETPTAVFANARNPQSMAAWNGYARPEIGSLTQNSSHSLTLSLNWKSERAISGNVVPFIHFVNDAEVSTNGGIVFQGNYVLSRPPSSWVPGQVYHLAGTETNLPATVADGHYSVRVGLLDQQSGQRLPLIGHNDGSGCYIVGYLVVANHGTSLTWLPPSAQTPDPRLNSTAAVLTFPSLQTNGMVYISQEQGNWVLRPLPMYEDFQVRLSVQRFPVPASLTADGSTPLPAPVVQGGYWLLPLHGATKISWPIAP